MASTTVINSMAMSNEIPVRTYTDLGNDHKLAIKRKNFLLSTLTYWPCVKTPFTTCEHVDPERKLDCFKFNQETLYTREKESVVATCTHCGQVLYYPNFEMEDVANNSRKLYNERAGFFLVHSYNIRYECFRDFLIGETDERHYIWAFVVREMIENKEHGLCELAIIAEQVLISDLDIIYFLQTVRAIKSCPELYEYHEITDKILQVFVHLWEERTTTEDSPYEYICDQAEIPW